MSCSGVAKSRQGNLSEGDYWSDIEDEISSDYGLFGNHDSTARKPTSVADRASASLGVGGIAEDIVIKLA